MATSDLFKRSVEIGTSIVDISRDRAEALVKEWVDAGDLGRGKAKKAVDDLVDRSHRITDELRSMIRREITEQLATLGVATADDLARIEAKIDAVAAASGQAPPPAKAARRQATKAAPITKAASAKKATAGKASTKKASTKKASTKSAPTQRAGSRKAAITGPGTAGPAGADPGPGP